MYYWFVLWGIRVRGKRRRAAFVSLPVIHVLYPTAQVTIVTRTQTCLPKTW
jgi:hypothetical protein